MVLDLLAVRTLHRTGVAPVERRRTLIKLITAVEFSRPLRAAGPRLFLWKNSPTEQ